MKGGWSEGRGSEVKGGESGVRVGVGWSEGRGSEGRGRGEWSEGRGRVE